MQSDLIHNCYPKKKGRELNPRPSCQKFKQFRYKTFLKKKSPQDYALICSWTSHTIYINTKEKQTKQEGVEPESL